MKSSKFEPPGSASQGEVPVPTTASRLDQARKTASKILDIESRAVASLAERLDESFNEALRILSSCRGRVVVTGVGKSGIICRKLAATLSSTGTPSLYLHPVEAIHGDLGMVAPGDIVVMLSNSGESVELLNLLATLKRLGIPIVSLVGDKESTLAKHSEVVLDVGVDKEACPLGLAPSASTTAALALGDALALALSQYKGFLREDFGRLHPGGILGKKLALVRDLMHAGERFPRVSLDTSMKQVIYEMSRKGLGVTSVADEDGLLKGVISDGDLRRLLEREESVLSKTAATCMTPNPITISPDELATTALNLMEQRKVTALMVVGRDRRICGIIHLHDLWGTELI